MKKATFYTTAFFLCCLLSVSCHRQRNEAAYTRFQQWDATLQEQPEAMRDSLQKIITPKKLSRANRAYYGLLKTIADDKTFTPFTSDSLISSVENYYARHNKQSDNHIRSLIYQGIVRYRMEIPDSIVFIPLKEAEKLYLKQKQPNPNTGYMLYYYLGKLLAKNEDRGSAHAYYNKVLELAKKENNGKYIFDSYVALYWNEMIQENVHNGKLYLDSLVMYADNSSDTKMTLLNAQSFYFDTQQDSKNRLECEKKQLTLIPHLKEPPPLYSLYYSISDAYSDNHQLDSAMNYALSAIEYVTDSTFQLNYLLYENVADIAERQHNLPLALEYRKKAFDTYEATVNKRLNTKILELEKQYNLSEVENKALKAQAHIRVTIGIALFLLFALAMLLFDWNRRRRIAALEKTNAAHKLLLAQQQVEEKGRMSTIVLPYLNLHASLQQELLVFTNKIRAKDNNLADKYEQLLKSNRQNFSETTQQLFTDEWLSKTLKNAKGLDLLNQADRMLLFMLAVGATNHHIVALLNTTPVNLKSKKSYLKRKIQANTAKFDNPEYLLSLF